MYPVTDVARARHFYEAILGLTVGKVSERDNGAWVEYDLPGGGCFAITTFAQGVVPSANAGGSIAFEVENIEELASRLKSAGVEFKLDVFSSPVCQMAVIVDSEGNAIILHQLKK